MDSGSRHDVSSDVMNSNILGEISGKLWEITDYFLLGAYRKVLMWSRLVTLLITSGKYMTSHWWRHNLHNVPFSIVLVGIKWSFNRNICCVVCPIIQADSGSGHYDVSNDVKKSFEAKYLNNGIPDSFLVGVYKKVPKGSRMVTSTLTSRDPVTS